MVNCFSFTPLDNFKSYPTHCKGGILGAIFTSKNAVCNNLMKNLDVIVVTGPNFNHFLITAAVDTAGLPSTSVPLVKQVVRSLKQINFELLRCIGGHKSVNR